jgi:DNA-binding response OmpR family regulator
VPLAATTAALNAPRTVPRHRGMTTTTTTTRTALLLSADPESAHATRAALEARGFTVREARDGVSGLDALTDELLHLDVLVAALDLPGRDGASLVELVRGAGGEHELPIVVLARESATLRARLVALGADAVATPGEEAASAALDAIARRRVVPGPAPRRARVARRRPMLPAWSLSAA